MRTPLLFSAALLACCLTLSAHAQQVWVKSPHNPIIPAQNGYSAEPAVVFDSTSHKYKMWYSAFHAGTYHIFYATSNDGIAWTNYVNNPVLSPGTTGAWDSFGVRSSAVVSKNGTYYLFYFATGVLSGNRIGLAKSQDGIHWERFQGNPILSPGNAGAWDDNTTYHPKVVFAGGKFYMWYAGSNGSLVQGGLATSTDGQSWTKHPNNPVLKPGVSNSWDEYRVWPSSGVVFKDGKFVLLYTGVNFSNASNSPIGLATSNDGIVWEKELNNPVLLDGGSGTWDDDGLGNGSLLFDGKRFELWYSGHDASGAWRIGYAESGVSDYALQFDGLDDLVQIDEINGALDLNDFTLEAWVYRMEENTTEEIIHKGGVGENPSVNTNYALLFREDNFARAHFELADSRNIEVTGTTRILTGKWYHLAGVHSSTEKTLKIYVNGVLDAPPLQTDGVPNQQNSPVRLGANDPGWNLDENFKGLIDEVRIWKRARTQAEIQNDMNNALQGNEDGLVAYWRLNEGEGQVVHDLTTNAIPGHRGLSENADAADPIWVLANRAPVTGCNGIPLPAGEAYGNINANRQTHMDKITYCFDGPANDRYLSFAVYDIDQRDEVSVSLNGETVLFAPLTANNTWSSLVGVLLSNAQIHDGHSNSLVFDNTRNPPQTWRYGVRQVSVDPFYALPSPAAYGNITGGDTEHADKVVYFFSGRAGDLNLAYQVFDIDHLDEVDIVLNDTKVKDETLTSNETWSETRTLLLPDELVHNTGVNVLIFENTKNPPRNWRWGVRNVSVSAVATSSLALAGQTNASVNGHGVLNGRYLMDGQLAPPLREHGDPAADTSHYVIQGATTIATNGHALIELPSVQKIDYLTLYPEWHAARYFSYRVETSADGSNWSTALDRMNVKLRGVQTERIAKTNVRYLRLTGVSFVVDPDSSLLNGLSESAYWQNYTSLLQQAQPEALAIAELVLIKQEGSVKVDEPALEAPKQYHLAQNLPNPFNPSTIIRFDLPQAERVHLAIYNLRGELVATLVDGNLAPGSHAFTFDGRGLATGVYFYRVTTEKFSATKKMLLAK
jgi:predicted GH43/DUF377 family glycosyl hydrolase